MQVALESVSIGGCGTICAETAEDGIMDDTSNPHHPIEKTATEARQGVTTGRMRWVLGISIVAVIVAFAISYWAVIG